MNTVKSLLAATLLVTLALPLAAQAAVTQTLEQGSNPVTVLDSDREVLFQITNPTTQGWQLVVPEVGMTYDIPPSSQDTYYLDGRKITKKEIGYAIKLADGSTYATGKISNPNAYSSSISLSQIINYSTAYKFEEKQAPTYWGERSQTRSASQSVRGYW